jgi:hypothetical protein
MSLHFPPLSLFCGFEWCKRQYWGWEHDMLESITVILGILSVIVRDCNIWPTCKEERKHPYPCHYEWKIKPASGRQMFWICGKSKDKEKVKLPCNRPWRSIGLWDVEAPTFSRQSDHRWRWGYQPYAPAAVYLQEDSWYSFLLEAQPTPGP